MGLPATAFSHVLTEKLYAPVLERQLVDKFETQLIGAFSSTRKKISIRHELGVGRNIADLVLFLLPAEPRPIFSTKLSASESVVLSLLRERRHISITELQGTFSFSDKQLLIKILRLVRAGVVKLDDEMLTFIDHWPPLKTIAYEAKLKHWREALEQAEEYLNYADESYVVMPSGYLYLAEENLEQFKVRNIGLISVSEVGFHIVVEARAQIKHDWRREFVYSRAISEANA